MEIINLSRFEIPKEILKFLNDTFEIYEIRVRVGETKEIKFIIHTNDHGIPHVHAEYDKYNVSISLNDFSVLDGNIPSKNKKIAISWVKENKDYLLSTWKDKVIVSNLPLTNTRLDMKES